MVLILLMVLAAGMVVPVEEIFLPVGTVDRHSVEFLQLTHIGRFGVRRKARPAVPSHYHTGIDIRRPTGNYLDEPIFPVAYGTVISKRTDGPYAQLIIEHNLEGRKIWSVYEHIGGIVVSVSSRVDPLVPIARFLTREELDHYGWQFDHVHLELLREKPLSLSPAAKTPERLFASYTLECTSLVMLNRYFYDPLMFFRQGR